MSNRVTVEQMRGMAVGQIAALPIDQIKLLADDIDEILADGKKLKDWLQGALHMRFGLEAASIRREGGKDTGKVTIPVGDFAVAADLPKKVEWDQKLLAGIEAQLVDAGEDPAGYITVERKVSEAKFNNWPPALGAMFIPARTVTPGNPAYKIEARKQKGAR